MRSISLAFADASHEEIDTLFERLGARRGDPYRWYLPASGELLFVDWDDQTAEMDRKYGDEISRPSTDVLGSELRTRVMIDCSGRATRRDVLAVVLQLLRAHRGVAEDDWSERAWTLDELDTDAIVAGRRFFEPASST